MYQKQGEEGMMQDKGWIRLGQIYLRPITEADRNFYRRGCPFDVDEYLVPDGPGNGDQALP